MLSCPFYGGAPSGYSWRALVESDVSRWKRVIGDGLRSRTNERQATEVVIAADVPHAAAAGERSPQVSLSR